MKRGKTREEKERYRKSIMQVRKYFSTFAAGMEAAKRFISQLAQAALKMLCFAAGNVVRKADFRIMSYEKTIFQIAHIHNTYQQQLNQVGWYIVQLFAFFFSDWPLAKEISFTIYSDIVQRKVHDLEGIRRLCHTMFYFFFVTALLPKSYGRGKSKKKKEKIQIRNDEKYNNYYLNRKIYSCKQFFN